MKESFYSKAFRVFNENEALIIGVVAAISATIALIGWFYAE
jgi:hypothetical protein